MANIITALRSAMTLVEEAALSLPDKIEAVPTGRKIDGARKNLANLIFELEDEGFVPVGEALTCLALSASEMRVLHLALKNWDGWDDAARSSVDDQTDAIQRELAARVGRVVEVREVLNGGR